MTPLLRLYDFTIIALAGLAGAAIFALAFAITADVVLRNMGITNFPWLLEVTEYVLFGATFLASPWVLKKGAHVRVDIVVSNLSATGRRMLEFAADALGLAVSGCLGFYALRVGLESYGRGDLLFKEIVIPEWPFFALVAFASLLLCVEFICRMVAKPEGSA
ncbi:MAG: TRAP transporter small permease [Pseudomonadota bacterium]